MKFDLDKEFEQSGCSDIYDYLDALEEELAISGETLSDHLEGWGSGPDNQEAE